jgi:hypothetical protein
MFSSRQKKTRALPTTVRVGIWGPDRVMLQGQGNVRGSARERSERRGARQARCWRKGAALLVVVLSKTKTAGRLVASCHPAPTGYSSNGCMAGARHGRIQGRSRTGTGTGTVTADDEAGSGACRR